MPGSIEELKPHCTNWAGNLTYHAGQLDSPRTVDELREIVRGSRKVRALGSRHSFNTVADSDVRQVSLAHFDSIDIDPAARTVSVGAGVRYGTFAPLLDAKGFAVHNLASLPHITVVGAVATATHGSGVHNGNLGTAVSALEMVTADGSVVHLSRKEHGDQFLGAAVALGSLGVVTRVTLDIVPRFEMTQVVYRGLSFDQLEHNLEAIFSAGYSVSLFTDWQNNRIAQVWIKDRTTTSGQKATILPDFYGAKPATQNMHPIEANSAENCTEQLGIPGPWYERLPHFRMNFTPSNGAELQTEYLVPRDRGYEAIRAVQTLSDRIAPLLFITELRTIAADQLWLSTACRQDSLAIHFTWKPMTPDVMALLPHIEAKLAPFGARPHWGKLFTIPPAQLAALYPRLADFRALARHYDPEGKFRNHFVEHNLFTLAPMGAL
ncbi:MAG TPA: D-arabinono-1,4-lactone oxidase [Acidobacteriaceae bacterium]|nr:D-arabinono-1,4-lactone oxidase [Acidobacteriaceae bacterium]